MIHGQIRKRLLERKGLADVEPKRNMSVQQLESQLSSKFVELMDNRMMMGALRYGPIDGAQNPGRQHGWNVQNALKRANEYLKSGNAELLVDVANFCMCEFEQQSHPKYHFEAKDRS